MLNIFLQPSRRLSGLLSLAHGLALACVLLVPLALLIKLAAALAIVGSLIYLWGLHGARRWPHSVTALHCDRDGGLLLGYRDGSEQVAQVLLASTVSPLMTILLFRCQGQIWARAAIILPDAAPAELFRQLRVWLKWKVGSGAQAAAGLVTSAQS